MHDEALEHGEDIATSGRRRNKNAKTSNIAEIEWSLVLVLLMLRRNNDEMNIYDDMTRDTRSEVVQCPMSVDRSNTVSPR